MTPPLSPELEQQIDNEATEAATVGAWTQEDHAGNKTIHRPYVNGVRKEFYKKGAIPYAELWQQAEQRAERYEKALKDIASGKGLAQLIAQQVLFTPKITTNDKR